MTDNENPVTISTTAQEIQYIALARINNGAHYQFVSAVTEKAKADAAVYGKAKAMVDALDAAVAQENDALMLSRKSALSDVIAEADRQRDTYYRGYRHGVRSFRSFPTGEQKTAADTLWQHLADYGIDPRMQLDRETGLMTNFIEDLQGKFSAQVTALSLKPFVDGMKQANDTVRTSLADRDTEQSGKTLGELKMARTVTDAAYYALVKRVNAYAEIEGDAGYLAFITYVNEQINRFKQEVLPSAKKLASAKPSVKARLAELIPVFETEQGLASGSLSYAGHTGSLMDGTEVYLLYVNGSADNLIWVKIDGDKLTKVNYLAGPGQPGGVK